MPEGVRRFADGVLVGPAPTPTLLDALAGMGVRTIVSVDAAKPDVEAAQARSLRYVHIPVQYAGIASDERLSLIKTLRDAKGPIYIHCHHGVHRGPAAAAYALVAEGAISNAEGVALLSASGTSPGYPGLYEVVRGAQPLTADQEAAMAEIKLVESATVSGVAASMAAIDRAWSHLRSLEKNRWHAPTDHPDLVAEAEAAVLADYLRALMSDDDASAQGEPFMATLATATQDAATLEAALIAQDFDRAARRFESLGASCTSCHEAHRNDAGAW